MRSKEPIPSHIKNVAIYLKLCLYDDSSGVLAFSFDIDLKSETSEMGALNKLKNLSDQIERVEKQVQIIILANLMILRQRTKSKLLIFYKIPY